MSAGPLIRISPTVWVRSGHVAGLRYLPPIESSEMGQVTRAELEVELVTESIYRLHGEDAEKLFGELEAGTSPL